MNERIVKVLLVAAILGLMAWVVISQGLLNRGSPAAAGAQSGVVPVVLTDSDFATTIAGTDKPVLVDFWAEWCPPCKMMAPAIDGLASDMGDRAVVAKLDVDRSPATAKKYKISALPTIVIFKGGKEVERLVGMQGQDVMTQRLEALLR